jgi:hypothetical protein
MSQRPTSQARIKVIVGAKVKLAAADMGTGRCSSPLIPIMNEQFLFGQSKSWRSRLYHQTLTPVNLILFPKILLPKTKMPV